MALAPEQTGIGIRRHFTTEGVHPYDELEWEHRDARITNYRDGSVAFEQRDVEFPVGWSQNATNIVAQKYFRGSLGSPEREGSLRQVIDRVVTTITAWGRRGGYFVDDNEAEAFRDELTSLVANQRAAFNSPVWFNIGVKGAPAQGSTCFILAVEDTMRSILNWYTEEGIIFQGGSGSGVNLSNIRSSYEQLKGGGTASGPVSFMRGADASAGTIKCLQADTQIQTDHGLVPIRDVQPGWRVPTRSGYRKVAAVHDNGTRPLVRLRTELGDEILCTPEHRFWVRGARASGWREAGQLRSDDYLVIDLSAPVAGAPQPLIQPERRPTREIRHSLPTQLDEPFALWLGWVFGDGSILRRPGTNFVAVQIGDKDEELAPRFAELTKGVFGDRAHLVVDRHTDRPDASVSVRFCSTQLLRFLEVNGLYKGKADALRIPPLVQSAPTPVRASFLAGLFEADGHVGNGYPTLSTVSHGLALDVHRMLLSLGIPSKIGRIDDRVAAYGTKAVHTVRVVGGEGVRRFAKLVGFVSERKSRALDAALERKGASPYETQWFLPHVANEFAVMWEEADGELSRALAPYCRYREIRRLSLLRARALLERFPRQLGGAPFASFAAGDEIYVRATVEPAGEGPTFDLTVEDAHEYLVDNLWTHNSGGKTRRAAKMVILNADHPDIETFVWCKAVEERKARVLRDAGFDMDLDGKDSHSTQYQNANNSVRVTDEFMQAVVDDRDWHLRAVTTGETVRTLKARDLFRQLAEAAWECADPGMQFDTTINRWHTASNTGRINGSNPCCFTGDTLVDTSWGLVPIEQLEKTDEAGQVLPEARSYDETAGTSVMRPILEAWVAGTTDRLVHVTTESGIVLRCTPEHRFLTASGAYIEAQGLTPGVALRALTEDGGRADDRVAGVEVVVLAEPIAVYDLEIEGTHNFCVAQDRSRVGHAVVVHNSEYMHLDNSACNLASLNLMKFLNEDGSFDVEGFRAAVQVLFTAQEILVGNADYPTEKIAETTRRFRQLGIGYANLGAMLMALGVPYDSDQGRAWAAAITALMTGEAYATSARTAARMGPFAGYSENREPMARVLRMHRGELEGIDRRMAPAAVLGAAQDAWDDAIALADIYGVRNSQASVLAPTGCLVGGTLVPTERGLVRLRSLGDPDGAQWQDLGIAVATDEGHRTATKFYVNGLEQVVSVETARGYRIQGTPQHRVKVVDSGTGTWEWKRFANITEGDLVPLALNQLVGEPQAVPLPPLPEAYWTGEHHVEAPRRMTSELAELVGYFMGDGSLHSRGLRFCVADTDFDVVERLERLGKEVFKLAAAVTPKTGYTEVAFHSVRLVLWWEACGFAKRIPSEAHTGKGPDPQREAGAHIPDAVLHSNDPEVYRGFLRGLYEADGTVTAGVPTLSSTTLDFAADVQGLLLALGYPTTRTISVTRTGWGQAPIAVLRLLNATNARQWAAEIGFLGERKSVAVTRSEATQTGRHDYVPLTRALVDRLVPENGRLRRVLLMELRRERVSRRIATELFEGTGDGELGHLLSFFYDRVESAELGDEELTYDLSVPANVTYVANGFVSHNTIGLMMDCDTTGIEPDLGLCKTKKLVGGGTMSIVNQTVPRALRRLGYTPDQVEDILAYVDENKSILGAPHLLADHLAVFACSMGDNVIHHLGHVKMMSAVQPWISGAISKCVEAGTLVTTADGLVRIGSLHRGEGPDTFRHEILEVASLNGTQKTDAFYYGGVRSVREARLRSGHRIVGTPNHRLLIAGRSGIDWRRLDELEVGDYVAVQYGDDLWSPLPARFDDFVASPRYGSQKSPTMPEEMTSDLAFLLGAYASQGHTTRSTWSVIITNSVQEVLERVVAAWWSEFGLLAKIVRQPGKCPGVVVSSKTVVEFLEYLGCGGRASAKRIPDAVVRSPREMVLAFLQGLALDAYTTVATAPKWAICLDSPAMLDDLQAVLTNLGIVHGRVSKRNAINGKTYDEVYAAGEQGQRLVALVPFLEPVKSAAAARLAAMAFAGNHATADVVPGISPSELYRLLPAGTTAEFAYLCDPRTRHATRRSVERVAHVPGVVLPPWLRTVIDDGLHFSPVQSVLVADDREVFDISVPATQAFVGNGIVNHNTVNVPETMTVDEVEQLHIDAWRLGLKALAIYRDNCKVGQPLSATKTDKAIAEAAEKLIQKVVVAQQGPVRRKMPRMRTSKTFSFRVADCHGYVTVGEYDDGKPGEIFLRVSKQGSTLAGIMDAFAISVSHGLQYGVPLRAFVDMYTNMRFEPAGMTDDPEIRFASSLVDYIFRRLAVEYLTYDERVDLGILTIDERMQPTLPGVEEQSTPTSTGSDIVPDPVPAVATVAAAAVAAAAVTAVAPSPSVSDAPYCYQCGMVMQRAGACFVCSSCGTTSGCS